MHLVKSTEVAESKNSSRDKVFLRDFLMVFLNSFKNQHEQTKEWIQNFSENGQFHAHKAVPTLVFIVNECDKF